MIKPELPARKHKNAYYFPFPLWEPFYLIEIILGITQSYSLAIDGTNLLAVYFWCLSVAQQDIFCPSLYLFSKRLVSPKVDLHLRA